MTWTSDAVTEDGVAEREFVIERDGSAIPGVVWSPSQGVADRLLLLGHGGTADKRADYIQEVARLAVGRGMEAVAIDGPGHGDRALDDLPLDQEMVDLERFEDVWHRGGGTAGIVADWQVTIDFIESQRETRPTGWWGLSMGTMMGLPLAAADERISVAVLGLMGDWGPNGADLVRLAPDVICPLWFLVQWDDEIVPRETSLALFDRLGSHRKTLHANPGAHAEVPASEVMASIGYLDRYLR